ncbi:uncharacterized protein B0T23DRAFT_203155 [Neurospora hispaniola]|uniref:Uncharacterized protein n=1 Tax=Neurospora hispaniola TaxID=588809 RepID=A0AAJ0I4B5_9PEZI|nr:hypothetical protein B0T23DRAFT_203155 [Neurospora hispaniola]
MCCWSTLWGDSRAGNTRNLPVLPFVREGAGLGSRCRKAPRLAVPVLYDGNSRFWLVCLTCVLFLSCRFYSVGAGVHCLFFFYFFLSYLPSFSHSFFFFYLVLFYSLTLMGVDELFIRLMDGRGMG